MSIVTDREHESYYEITKFNLDPLNGIYRKEDIVPYVKELFSLTGVEFKGIKKINSLNAVRMDINWVTKETCGWVDFYLYYYSWMSPQGLKQPLWRTENRDIKDLCHNMKYLLVSTEAFAEKDGYFYILEDIKLIKEINLEWTFST
jgi:hypothetical protein